MPHNHPPRCCCEEEDNGTDGFNPADLIPCASCVEHGELATLNSAPIDGDQCPEESPSTGARCLLKVGHPGAHLPTECPSCHAVGDQPHTDYCRAGMPDRGTGWAHWHDNGQRWYHLEGETCTEGNGMPDNEPSTQAQTSQPAATTSQPPTQTRGIFTDISHTVFVGSRHTTHLRALCRPDLCGQRPTPSQ